MDLQTVASMVREEATRGALATLVRQIRDRTGAVAFLSGTPPVIIAARGVTGVVRNSAGNYTITFANAAGLGGGGSIKRAVNATVVDGSGSRLATISAVSTTTATIVTTNAGVAVDVAGVYVTFEEL